MWCWDLQGFGAPQICIVFWKRCLSRVLSRIGALPRTALPTAIDVTPNSNPLAFLPGQQQDQGMYKQCPAQRDIKCCFAPPSVRNLGSSVLAISMVFPRILKDFQSISVDFNRFQSFSIIFSHLQSLSNILNHFQSFSITLNLSKTYEFVDSRKVGENNT